MSEQKHTPGPWEVQCQGPTEQVYVIDNPRMNFVCRMEEGTQEQKTVNARLIASAPELLYALKEARSMLETARRYFPKSFRNSDKFSLLNVLENAVKPAIAKAERGEA